MALSWHLELSVYPRIWEPLVIDCGPLRRATLHRNSPPAVAWQGAQECVWRFTGPLQHLLIDTVSRIDQRIIPAGLLICEWLRSE